MRAPQQYINHCAVIVKRGKVLRLVTKQGYVNLYSIIQSDSSFCELSSTELALLSIFSQPRTIDEGYQIFIRCIAEWDSLSSLVEEVPSVEKVEAAIFFSEKQIITVPISWEDEKPESDNIHLALLKLAAVTIPILWENERPELHDIAHLDPLKLLARHLHASKYPSPIFIEKEDFIKKVNNLLVMGTLTPALNHVNFGSFGKGVPICSIFGLSRGTPIDRYYLSKFIDISRKEIHGICLEIGGELSNQKRYKLNCSEFHALDLLETTTGEVDFIGDAHDPSIIPSNAWDSIIALNVLEHCLKPWIVIENIYKWLRPGGKMFCLVPGSQIIHRTPIDCWRILPDAFMDMTAMFSERRLYVYGNPLASVCSLYGVAVEEVPKEALDKINELYPVATCVIATK